MMQAWLQFFFLTGPTIMDITVKAHSAHVFRRWVY